jgi:hypothetical protein
VGVEMAVDFWAACKLLGLLIALAVTQQVSRMMSENVQSVQSCGAPATTARRAR